MTPARGRAILLTTCLFVGSVGLSLLAVRWIAETFFFDKFYYQKSLAHGYFPEGWPVRWEEFGDRARDMVALHEGIRACRGDPASCLPWETDEDDRFTIVLIGDSFVFGQGVRHRDRFAVRLERELDALRPTRVVSLGNSGDNVLENYLKYHWIQKLAPRIDLTIFALMDNDLLINDAELYDPALHRSIAQACAGKPLYYNPTHQTDPDPTIPYEEHVKASFDAERHANYCVLEELVARHLPGERALYFFFTGRWGEAPNLEKYIAPFRRRGLRILDVGEYIEQHYPDRPRESFYVSPRDGHPSRFANQLFTEFLLEEISRDPVFASGP